MSNKLSARIDNYQELTDYKLLGKVPIIICVNGKTSSKTTSLLDKPYCIKFADAMLATTIKLCSEVEGTLFAYQHNDEIVIVVRNDQSPDTSPWFDNKLQKICSITASIATLYFNKYSSNEDLNLLGDVIFTSQIFAVPTIAEAINTIVYKQQHNFHTSIQFACFYELLKTYDKEAIKNMLGGLSVDEKIDLLNQECNVNFNEYSPAFRRGSACYKSPKLVNGIMKNKWTINQELPIFTRDTSFLSNIFRMGSDIFRKESF